VAGNKATDSHSDKLDTLATITITNDGSGGDHIFNQNEAGAVNVSGTTTGVEEGDRSCHLLGRHQLGIQHCLRAERRQLEHLRPDTGPDLSEQGKISVTASVADKAGNAASDSVNNDVLDTQATITIANDGSGSDGVFNKSEAAGAAVSGTTTGVEAGQIVTLTFTDSANHVVTTTAKVGSDGSWSVPAQSLSTLVRRQRDGEGTSERRGR
jgi:hypothetical protein